MDLGAGLEMGAGHRHASRSGSKVLPALSRGHGAVRLRNAGGAELHVPRHQIEALNKSRLSMMPEGLLQALTREEATDLFAFL